MSMQGQFDMWLVDTAMAVGSAALIVLLFIGIETVRPITRQPFWRSKEARTEIGLLLLYTLLVPLMSISVTSTIEVLMEQLVPATGIALAAAISGLPWIVQFLIAIVVVDFVVYLRHRFSHHYFWSFHGLHHNAREISWTTHYRIHPIENLFILIVQSAMLLVIGFTGDIVAASATFASWYSLFVHSNLNIDLPAPWRYMIGTPYFHRWHHALEPEAVDKNFAVVFPWIDLLFGTYYAPARLPRAYGIFEDTDADIQRMNVIEFMLRPFRKKNRQRL